MLCWAKLLQSCLTLLTPWAVSLQAPLSVGILQARTLEWVAMPSSRGSSTQRWNPCLFCLLHWWVGSLPLVPPQAVILKKHFRQPKVICGCSMTWREYLQSILRKTWIIRQRAMLNPALPILLSGETVKLLLFLFAEQGVWAR